MGDGKSVRDEDEIRLKADNPNDSYPLSPDFDTEGWRHDMVYCGYPPGEGVFEIEVRHFYKGAYQRPRTSVSHFFPRAARNIRVKGIEFKVIKVEKSLLTLKLAETSSR